MGLGGPVGGYVNDRFGWRWAFFMQIPLFVLSFILTGYNLHYVTPVRSFEPPVPALLSSFSFQGQGTERQRSLEEDRLSRKFDLVHDCAVFFFVYATAANRTSTSRLDLYSFSCHTSTTKICHGRQPQLLSACLHVP